MQKPRLNQNNIPEILLSSTFLYIYLPLLTPLLPTRILTLRFCPALSISIPLYHPAPTIASFSSHPVTTQNNIEGLEIDQRNNYGPRGSHLTPLFQRGPTVKYSINWRLHFAKLVLKVPLTTMVLENCTIFVIRIHERLQAKF